ncbi:MAG: hypothetical protein KBF76_20950 [Verrucomicrobiales bacterium]|nr:hypothetical protein [Verrucomicrobiales bacterium]
MKQVFWGFLLLLAPAFTAAALPPLSPETLEATAEVIVTARVVGSRVMIHRKPSASVYFVRLMAEVDTVEKGSEWLGDSRFLDIRCWRIRQSDLVGPIGHDSIPGDGSSFRAWLRRNADGKWEPLEPNGIVLLAGGTEREFSDAERRQSALTFLIAGLVGITGLAMFGVFQWNRRRKRRLQRNSAAEINAPRC